MSRKFEFVKAAYERGTWNRAMVRNAVTKGWITAEEYEIITGVPFE